MTVVSKHITREEHSSSGCVAECKERACHASDAHMNNSITTSAFCCCLGDPDLLVSLCQNAASSTKSSKPKDPTSTKPKPLRAFFSCWWSTFRRFQKEGKRKERKGKGKEKKGKGRKEGG